MNQYQSLLLSYHQGSSKSNMQTVSTPTKLPHSTWASPGDTDGRADCQCGLGTLLDEKRASCQVQLPYEVLTVMRNGPFPKVYDSIIDSGSTEVTSNGGLHQARSEPQTAPACQGKTHRGSIESCSRWKCELNNSGSVCFIVPRTYLGLRTVTPLFSSWRSPTHAWA